MDKIEGLKFDSETFDGGEISTPTLNWKFTGVSDRDMTLFVKGSCGCTVTDKFVELKKGEPFLIKGYINLNRKLRGPGVKQLRVKEVLKKDVYGTEIIKLNVNYKIT